MTRIRPRTMMMNSQSELSFCRSAGMSSPEYSFEFTIVGGGVRNAASTCVVDDDDDDDCGWGFLLDCSCHHAMVLLLIGDSGYLKV